jgi:hypothetical protein
MPIFIPLGWTLVALGAAAAAKILVREWRRVNELRGSESLREAPAREKIRVLRRDPKSGIYRPE